VKSTAKARPPRRQTARSGPLSVALPPDLRERIGAQAKKRNLKLATAARVFLAEHVEELEDSTDLAKAEEWQRAQAWATWDKITSGDVRDVSWDELSERARRGLAQVEAGKRRA
jgi:predicted DNA-binding protein